MSVRGSGYWLVNLAAVGLCVVSPLLAQQTKTVDAGAGQKQEMVYDAKGQIVEARTIDAQGKIRVRVQYEFKPGFYGTHREITTNYFPDGKSISMLAETSYDENGNFASQAIAGYDATGKQTEGHRVAHDAATGVYRCWKWDATAGKDRVDDCPAGEESGGEPAPLKPLTEAQAIDQLKAAHESALAQKTATGTEAQAPASPAAADAKTTEVGIILPAQFRAGDRISGSVTGAPEKFEGIPELTVTRVKLPTSSSLVSLADWAIEVPGESGQSADRPFVFSPSSSAGEMKFTFRKAGTQADVVPVTTKVAATSKAKTPSGYMAPALCSKNGVCAVAGKFSGDAGNTFAAFGTVPATVMTETPTAVYLLVPNEALRGPQYLLISDQRKLLAFQTAVAELEVHPDDRAVKAGEDVLMHVTLEGPGDMADAQWRAGVFPANNLQRARNLAPDFRLQKETREQHEEREKREKESKHEEGKEGAVVLAIRNLTPEVVSFRGSDNGSYAFSLTPESFSAGAFQYNFVVHPLRDGAFAVRSAVIPFLAGSAAQEFQLPADLVRTSSNR